MRPWRGERIALEALWLVGDGEGPDLPHPEVSIVRSRHPANGLPPHPVEPNDMLAILYTSGTTGLSKGVCCPHAQYFWWAFYTGELLGVGETDVLMTTLPMFHTNALNSFYQALLNGASLVVEPRFSASGFIRGVTEQKRDGDLRARRYGADPAGAGAEQR